MRAYIVKELLHYCNVNLRRSSKIVKAPIDYYDFTFVLKGAMTYVVDGKTYVISENDAIFIKPGSLRERIPMNTPAKYVSYNFTAYGDAALPKQVYLKNIINHDIRNMVSIFSASHLSDIYASREKAMNLLNYILLEIKDIIDLESNNKHIIGIIKYINEHIAEKISLSSISEHLNLSREYTSHIFKKETGKTVTDYINERKLMIAKEMVLSTNYPLTYISERLGYENYSYFSKVFKNQFDTTPRILRKNGTKL